MSTADVPEYPFQVCPALDVLPEYERLRKEEPVTRVKLPFGGDAWLLTRYEDVRFVLSDSRFSRAESARADVPRFFEQPVKEGLGYADPPEHTRIRSVVNRAFTARRVERFRAHIEQIIDELLTDLASGSGPIDLQSRFAQPLAGRAIGDFTGIPYADRHRFEPFFRAIVSTSGSTPDEVAQAMAGAQSYFAELVTIEKGRGGDTFFADLVRENEKTSTMSDAELVNLALGVVIAGYETTSSQLANSVYLLLRDPAQLDLLREEPDLISSAVEELLRFTPLLSYGGNPFVATSDVTIGRVAIRKGEVVVPSVNAGNRDERAFSDPERLDLRRNPNPHLTFNHGAHHCLGAQLARAELELGIGGLVRRFPKLRLAVDVAAVPWKANSVLRAPRELPVFVS